MSSGTTGCLTGNKPRSAAKCFQVTSATRVCVRLGNPSRSGSSEYRRVYRLIASFAIQHGSVAAVQKCSEAVIGSASGSSRTSSKVLPRSARAEQQVRG
jgi:hypothetical protein